MIPIISGPRNGGQTSGQAAEFHSHRPHTPVSLVGAVHYRRAYYLCRHCGQGLFPFDRQAGLTSRNLTPALERIAALAGAVADSLRALTAMATRWSGFDTFPDTFTGGPTEPGSGSPPFARFWESVEDCLYHMITGCSDWKPPDLQRILAQQALAIFGRVEVEDVVHELQLFLHR